MILILSNENPELSIRSSLMQVNHQGRHKGRGHCIRESQQEGWPTPMRRHLTSFKGFSQVHYYMITVFWYSGILELGERCVVGKVGAWLANVFPGKPRLNTRKRVQSSKSLLIQITRKSAIKHGKPPNIRVGVPVTFLPLKLTREIQFAGARGSIPRHGIFWGISF